MTPTFHPPAWELVEHVGDLVALVVPHGESPALPRPWLDVWAGQVRFRHDRRRGALTTQLSHRRDGDPADHFLGAAAVNLHAGPRLISKAASSGKESGPRGQCQVPLRRSACDRGDRFVTVMTRKKIGHLGCSA